MAVTMTPATIREDPFMYPTQRNSRPLDSFGIGQLEQLVERLAALVQDTAVVNRLPDKGFKVNARLQNAQSRLAVLVAARQKEDKTRVNEERERVSQQGTSNAVTAEEVSSQVDDLLAQGMKGVSLGGRRGGIQGKEGVSGFTKRLPKVLTEPRDTCARRGDFESMSMHRLHPHQRKTAVVMNGPESIALAHQTQEAERKYKMSRARAKLRTLVQDPAQRAVWASTTAFPSVLPTTGWRDVRTDDSEDEDDDIALGCYDSDESDANGADE